MSWSTILGALGAAALWTTAALFAFRAAQTARTPQGAVGWVVFLLSAPILAAPIYLFLGHSRYPGRVTLRRSHERVVAALDEARLNENAAVRRPRAGKNADARGFEALAEMPIVGGSGWRLLIDGAETFGAIFAAIEAAQSYVLVSFYIIRDDRLGRRFAALLARKAGEGVKVRLIYDRLGCVGLPEPYLRGLAEAGVEARDFHGLHGRRSPFQINFRNHRKIVVCDGEIGLIGGLNVGDEYLGEGPLGAWRDTHLELRGPVVAQLQLVYAEDWRWASGETPELHWRPAPVEDGTEALILAPGPADPHETGALYFANAVAAARRRIWIASPYLVPDTEVAAALKLAALRGIDVRLLVPAIRDHLTVGLAAFAFFDELREAGVRIWRYREGFMHQKALVVDEAFASVGTINLDTRSCRLNFEATAILFGPAPARAVASMLEADFARAKERVTTLAGERPLIRFGAPVARLFAPLL